MKNNIFRVIVVFCCFILLVCPMFSASALTFPGTVTFNNALNIPFESVSFNDSSYAIDQFTMETFVFGENNVYNRNANNYVSIYSDVNNELGMGSEARILTTVLAPDHADTTYYRATTIIFFGLDNVDDGLYQVDLFVMPEVLSDGNDVYFDSGRYCTEGLVIDGGGILHPGLIVYDDADSITFSLVDGFLNNIFNRFDGQFSYEQLSSKQYILSIRKPFYDDLIGGGNDDGSYNEGYNDGYDDGYNLGSSEVFGENLLGQTFNAPLEALNQWVLFETPGGIEVTMGGLFTAVIALAVLIIFLKMFAGG